MFYGAELADEDNQEESTQAIRAVNEHIHADHRVDVSMLPIGDGRRSRENVRRLSWLCP